MYGVTRECFASWKVLLSCQGTNDGDFGDNSCSSADPSVSRSCGRKERERLGPRRRRGSNNLPNDIRRLVVGV